MEPDDVVRKRLVHEENNMETFSIQCSARKFDRLELLTTRYTERSIFDIDSPTRFAQFLIKLYDTSVAAGIKGDYIVPILIIDPDWDIVAMNYDYMMNEILGTVDGRKLLKHTYHPKTTSVFKRIMTVTIWHRLLFNAETELIDPMAIKYALELKSTVNTIPGPLSLAFIDKQKDHIMKMIAKLESQEWWRKTDVPE